MAEREARAAYYEDLDDVDFAVESEGDDDIPWSDRISRLWQISDIYGSETLSVTVIELDPGDSTPMHAHRDPVEEYYVVLKGMVDVELEDDLWEGATPGTIAYFPPGVQHRPVNNYDETSVQLGFRSLRGETDALHENLDVSDES